LALLFIQAGSSEVLIDLYYFVFPTQFISQWFRF